METKQVFFFWGVFSIFLLGGCDPGAFDTVYRLELPPAPSAWVEILGVPHWRVAWISPEGAWEAQETADTGVSGIRVLQEWTNPVIAYPYWPERGILPEVMRPAGALFPFDVDEGRIRLSWRGGVDVLVYLELAAQAAAGSGDGVKTPRLPHYFNWPRFRELLEDTSIPEAVRYDPWVVDWQSIVYKIVQSGFDRRRIVPQVREELSIPVPQGNRWIGASPFAEPVNREAGDSLHLLVTSKVDTYLSSAGILRCTKGVWIWLPWE
ncbi:MAG: hypothetical protein LBT14_11220 [Treponema sp.]|jgi:hypothetical protein|nr:hypothetical protein [Treponema sp.]